MILSVEIKTGSPNPTIDRTFRAVFEFVDPARRSMAGKRTPRVHRNPVCLAREWQKMLDDGVCKSKAELSRELGVSRARVTQILCLLRLAPELVTHLAALGDPLPSPIITERQLRSIARRSAEEQREQVADMLADQP